MVGLLVVVVALVFAFVFVVCLSRLKQFYVVNPDVTFVIFAVSLANVVVVAVVGVSKGKLATQEVSGSG